MNQNKSIRCADIDTAYELAGPESAPVIMMSHSLATSTAMWEPQWQALKSSYRLLRYDTRGHGASSAPEGPYSLSQLADDAAALMQALDIDAVHWLGLSMGGMIGQQLALSHPSRLRSLILADTASAVPAAAGPAWDERAELAINKGMSALVEPTMERWLSPDYQAREPGVAESVREMIRNTPPAGYAACCAAIKALNLTEALSTITAPTLVLVGEDDEGTPVSAAEVIASSIRDARLQVIPAARHLSNLEQQQLFNEHVQKFLSG